MRDRWLKNPPPPLVIFVSAVVLVVAALIDQQVAREIGAEVFYLVPVVLAAWYLDSTWAGGFAVLGAGAWILLDLVGQPAMWDPLITVWNGLTRLLVFSGAGFVISMLREALRKGRALTRIDELTGVGNSTVFYDTARQEIERCRRSGAVMTVAFFDVDGFDEVAKRQGRGGGERLLKVVASSMDSVIRSTDVLARLFDDEFAALFPETGRMDAAPVLLKVAEEVARETRENGWDAAVRMGAVTFATPPESVNDMRRALEDALHAARERGRDVIEHRVVGVERMPGESETGVRVP